MRVWALWHGGHSYATPNIRKDLELFGSLRLAKEEFLLRYKSAGIYRRDFNYVYRPRESTQLPAVDRTCEMMIWKDNPLTFKDINYVPDQVLRISHRGTVVSDQV